MKKRYLAAFAASVLSFNSFAGSVSCFVDTMAIDRFSQGTCYGGEHSPWFEPKLAFRVNAPKPVAKVQWVFSGNYNRSKTGTCTNRDCTVFVGFGESDVRACVDRIYYQDYTWSDVNWCATAYAYYTDGDVILE